MGLTLASSLPRMTASVRPMTGDEFTAFAARSVQDYATDIARSASIPLDAGWERAETQFAGFLPEGRSTTGHRLLTILDGERAIGSLWIGPHPQRESTAFVYDILIEEAERGRGFGRDAMLAAEDLAKADGSTAIGLNVFGFNERAQRLYASLDYGVVSTQMLKQF